MALRIVYVSTLQSNVTEEDVADLVVKAAAFNQSQGITGLLALEEMRVCQILEGPSEAVDALFQSIKQDPRHYGVVELVHATIDAPTFEAWGMVRRPMIDMVMTGFSLQA